MAIRKLKVVASGLNANLLFKTMPKFGLNGTYTETFRSMSDGLKFAKAAIDLGNKVETGVSSGTYYVVYTGKYLNRQKVFMASTAEDMTQYIKSAADSIEKLRKADVYRVLIESNGPAIRAKLAVWIKSKRPDLAGEVDEVLEEGD